MLKFNELCIYSLQRIIVSSTTTLIEKNYSAHVQLI